MSNRSEKLEFVSGLANATSLSQSSEQDVLYVSDSNAANDLLYTVNLSGTPELTPLSDINTDGGSTMFQDINAIEYRDERGYVLVLDKEQNALFAVDAMSGSRVLITKK